MFILCFWPEWEWTQRGSIPLDRNKVFNWPDRASGGGSSEIAYICVKGSFSGYCLLSLWSPPNLHQLQSEEGGGGDLNHDEEWNDICSPFRGIYLWVRRCNFLPLVSSGDFCWRWYPNTHVTVPGNLSYCGIQASLPLNLEYLPLGNIPNRSILPNFFGLFKR